MSRGSEGGIPYGMPPRKPGYHLVVRSPRGAMGEPLCGTTAGHYVTTPHWSEVTCWDCKRIARESNPHDWSYTHSMHTFDDGTELHSWAVHGPQGCQPGFVRCCGSGTAGTADEAVAAAQAYIALRL